MSQSLTVELLLFPQFVFLFCDIFLCTLLKKLKEHIESTSNLNGEKSCWMSTLIWVHWVMCQERKDPTSFYGNEKYQHAEGLNSMIQKHQKKHKMKIGCGRQVCFANISFRQLKTAVSSLYGLYMLVCMPKNVPGRPISHN